MTKADEVVNKKMVTSDRDSVLRTDFHFLFSLRNEAYQYISQDEINRTLQEVSMVARKIHLVGGRSIRIVKQ